MMRVLLFSLVLTLATAISSDCKLRAIHRISTLGSNVFILETDTSLFLIDAGYPKQEKAILDTLKKLNKRIELIILTHGHFDHSGTAKAIKQATGALVGIHRLDSADLCNAQTPLDSVNFIGFWGKLILPLAEKTFPPDSLCPDIVFNDTDTLNHFGLDARIVHTPGHTKGSCTIIVEDSIAFIGDLMTHSPFLSKQQYYANSWAQIDSSIEKLCRQQFIFAYAGHYDKPIAKQRILLYLDKGK